MSKKIAHQLLKGYLLMLFMLLTIAGMLYIAYEVYINRSPNLSQLNWVKFIETYESGADAKVLNAMLNGDDYVVVTDRAYDILSTYNAPLPEVQTFHDIQIRSTTEGFTDYFIFESEDGKTLFHFYLSPYINSVQFIYTGITVALLTFVVFAVRHAKATSQNIVVPIKKLEAGVHEITKGNYNHTISYTTHNELDSVKDTLNEMSRRLKEETRKRVALEEERSTLLMNLSHDIKPPLTNIIGYAQALSLKPLPKEIEQSVETIYKYGLIATELTDELFEFAKLNNDGGFEMMVKDVVEITKLKLIDYVNEFEEARIDYAFDLPEKRLYCQLNTSMYLRALDNLIQNTLKYNGSDFAFKVILTELDHEIAIVVQDDGIGIPESYHAIIFDPLIRVESSRNRALGGIGLGLSIAKQIVEKHRGTIELDSTYANGCRFEIHLPKCKPPAD